MQIGLDFLGQSGLNWDNWKAILEIADNMGYQCVFRSDHFSNPTGDYQDALELFTSLTYAASHTKNIEFGPLVTPITFRHPAFIAQYSASIDVLSGGRLVLGMGTGWQDREHESFGLYFPSLTERFERLTDGLEIVSRLLNSEGLVNYEGKHYSLKDAELKMKRKEGTKILVGGNGPKKTLPLAAKYAVEWNCVNLNHADFKERCELLDGYLENEDRNTKEVKRSLVTWVIYGKDDARVNAQLANTSHTKEELIERGRLVGTGPEVVDQLGKWEEAGCERIILGWSDLDDLEGLESMAKEVLPHFH
jgi:alkanesulfonate monooxygenase SsuD/methylene tetrahydromethanopterin reductase-like flavin-dependent oxidoreductase (luciferase family)